jgi:predicted enzyme related to lactoylglutathione lyase
MPGGAWLVWESGREGAEELSKRDGYESGVPCWVATVHPDPEKAVSFYTELFGWKATNLMPPGSPSKYFVCKLRGRDVAAIGSERDGALSVPAWDSYIWAESADDTVAEVTDAGGSVVIEPFDHLGAARVAVVADPAGAVFGVWQPAEHRGARLVNEPGAWSMSQLNTRDPEGAKAFYGAVFGWETDTFDMGEGEITLWRLPGFVGGEPTQPVSREVVGVMVPISDHQSPEDVSAHWSVDFWVHNVDAAADKAAELGGEVKISPFDTSVGKTAVLADPQDAVFSVSKVGRGT